MEEIRASTVVHVAPEEAYLAVRDCPGWQDHTRHVDRIRRRGDGRTGTEYVIVLSWWLFSHTARIRITDVDPPDRIDWRLETDADVHGSWSVEEVDAPPDRDVATRITFEALFGDTAVQRVTLPPLVSLDRVVARLEPAAGREAERIVAGVVADLEGAPRPVELEIHETPSFVSGRQSGATSGRRDDRR